MLIQLKQKEKISITLAHVRYNCITNFLNLEQSPVIRVTRGPIQGRGLLLRSRKDLRGLMLYWKLMREYRRHK